MRHKEPNFLVDYRTWRDEPPPRCCHTCERYDLDGVCDAYKAEPPADFVASINSCREYLQELPF